MFALVNCLSRLFISNEQSFSMYIPYADVAMSNIVSEGHCVDTICAHCACTALYNDSPVRFDMFVPPARSVVDHI